MCSQAHLALHTKIMSDFLILNFRPLTLSCAVVKVVLSPFGYLLITSYVRGPILATVVETGNTCLHAVYHSISSYACMVDKNLIPNIKLNCSI